MKLAIATIIALSCLFASAADIDMSEQELDFVNTPNKEWIFRFTAKGNRGTEEMRGLGEAKIKEKADRFASDKHVQILGTKCLGLDRRGLTEADPTTHYELKCLFWFR